MTHAFRLAVGISPLAQTLTVDGSLVDVSDLANLAFKIFSSSI